jgi:hypothetical protein
MTDDSVSRYFEFYKVNLNGEKKKNTEWFLGSNLQCCLHATVLLAVKCSAELNKYILLVRVICEKYRFRGQEKFPSTHGRLGTFASPLNRYFSQITLTNRIYLYNIIHYVMNQSLNQLIFNCKCKSCRISIEGYDA